MNIATMIKRLAALCLYSAVLLSSFAHAEGADRLIYSGESPYTGIQVYDKADGLRYMQFGVYEQTAMRMADPTYLHYDYTRSVMAGFAFLDRPVKKVLLMGLGGGTMPHFITSSFPDARLDIYEIDPLVVEVAEKFFKFRRGVNGEVSIGDGRRLLRKSKEIYDMIILDAYKAGGIPFHLTTREFMQSVREHLAPDGVVVVHLWAEYANKYLHAQVKTIADVFARNYSFYDNAGSFMIFATDHEGWIDKDALVERGRKIAGKHKFAFDLGRLISEQYTPASRIPTSGLEGQILTDDFAPVNLMREQRTK